METNGIVMIVMVIGMFVFGGHMLGANTKDHEHHSNPHHMHQMEKEDAKFKVHLKIELPSKTQKQLDRVHSRYFELSEALSLDDEKKAKKAVKQMAKQMKKVNVSKLSETKQKQVSPDVERYNQLIVKMNQAKTIKDMRSQFEPLSNHVHQMVMRYGTQIEGVGLFHCPMVNGNKGAHWLQTEEKVMNPYYGSMMFRCGSQVSDFGED